MVFNRHAGFTLSIRQLMLHGVFYLFALSASADVVNATWGSATDVPVTAGSYTGTGSTVNFTLNFAPATGTNLTVVNNTGLPFIGGAFDNLAQGQAVTLSYGGINYHYVAHYYGGTGNDLVLVWANNRALAWGFNFDGEVGDGTTTNRHLPTAVTASGVLAGKTIVAVATGYYHALALCADGTVAAWGNNGSGELGNNATADAPVPVAVNTDSGVSALNGKMVVAIGAGNHYSVALCSDGTVASWGLNNLGQLGNTSTGISKVPVAMSTDSGVSALFGKTVVSIAAGYDHCLALCSDGTVVAWGYNNNGQLGSNSAANSSNVPVAVNTDSGVSALNGKSVVSLSAGSFHSLALCSDGTVAAWGHNIDGELGNNSTTSSSVPVAVNTASGVSALYGKSVAGVSAGDDFSLALCSDGTLAAWGFNNFGQVGDNTTTRRSVPVAVNTASGVSALYGKVVVSASAFDSQCVALCADGTLAAWGSNTYGEIGDNTTTSRKVPVQVSAGALISGEQYGTLPGSSAATHWTLAVAAAPVAPSVTTQAATALAGTSAALNGTVVAAYDSMAVSFDFGTTTSYGTHVAAAPTPVTGGAATPVTAALTGLLPATTYHFRVNGTNSVTTLNGGDLSFTTLNNNDNLSALVLSTGTLSPAFSAGTTAYTVSVPYTTSSLTLTSTLADTNAKLLLNGAPIGSGTASWAVGLLEGSNTITLQVTAQDGTTTQTYSVVVTRATGPSLSSLGLDSGSLSPAFGSNTTSYQVAAASTTATLSLTPVVVDGTTTVAVNGSAVASGSTSSPVSLGYGDNVITVAVTSQDGTTTKTYKLLVTRAIPTTFSAAFATQSTVPLTTWGLTATGTTVNLALNYAPLAGAPLTLVSNSSPGAIGGTFSNLAQGQIVALSYNGMTYHFVADYYGGTGNDLVLRWVDSRCFAWGSDTNWQLGNPTSVIGPESIASTGSMGQKSIRMLATGSAHSMALCWDGSLSAWGSNAYGQLGSNAFLPGNTYLPQAVNATTSGSALIGKSVVALTAGATHSVALCTDGTVAAWGDNSYGQMGVSGLLSITNTTPMAVSTTSGVSALYGETVTAISAGAVHTLALCSDGTLVAWGYNANGQLGNLSTGGNGLPVAVNTAAGVSALSGRTVVAIAAGGYHNLALCSDGTLVSWGFNFYGQLGDNTTATRLAPVAVNTTSGVSALYGKTVVAIAAGQYHSMALCSDGTLVAWGANSSGQVGDNTITNRLVPVNVNTASGVSALYGKSVTSISAGSMHSLASCSDGTLAAWGENIYGEAGESTSISTQKVPYKVTGNAMMSAEVFGAGVTGPTSVHSLVLVASPPATPGTQAATAVTSTSATLNGTINANNGYSYASYDYGLTTVYGTNVQASPTSITGSTAKTASATITGLSPETTYHFRINGSSFNGADLTFTTLSLLQNWRQQYFGTTANTGITADSADYDGDGIPNLIEWACNLNPTAPSTLTTTTGMSAGSFVYTYSRSTSAANAGTTFTVEWSNTLASGSWSSTGVVQTVLSDDGTTQQVQATIPVTTETAKFVHLSVTAPP